MKPTSLEAFYTRFAPVADAPAGAVPPDMAREIGHFNIFNIADLIPRAGDKPPMTFDRRLYHKISLCRGRSRVEYADQVLDIAHNALFLATPRVPYRWVPLTAAPAGYFCIFNEAFLLPARAGVVLDELPVFRPGAYPVWEVTDADCAAVDAIFQKMAQEITSAYAYKYDLLRAYLWELIHLVQKLQPAPALVPAHSAAARVAARFADLLERQFPLESPRQRLRLRTATAYADQLAVHVNHLNRVLKEATGHTTTALIGGRMAQEAKLLLKQASWTVSEIADSLGFTDVAHFCTFFKRQTSLTPGDFRGQAACLNREADSLTRAVLRRPPAAPLWGSYYSPLRNQLMRVFVTGATGFVGSAIVQELLGAGHQVLGLARTEEAAQALLAAGAQVHRGNVEDLATLRSGAAAAEGAIHTAFNHDFSKFKENSETDRRAIEALGSVLAGSDRPLLVTSAVGLLPKGRRVTEADMPPAGSPNPRVASEEAADAVAAQGVRVAVVRLPPSVHGDGDHAFVPMLIQIARQKGRSVYAGDGGNHWPAVHRLDAARLFRLALERAPATGTRLHAVAEEGVAFRAIAEVIGQHLGVPAVSLSPEEAAAHFGWFAHFAAMDIRASSQQTQQLLGWQPTQPGLIADLNEGSYFAA